FVRLVGPPRTPQADSPTELGRHTSTATLKPSTSSNEFPVFGEPEEFDVAPATNGVVHATSDTLDAADLQSHHASPTRNSPLASLLASIPHNFSTEVLSGFWVTSYEYDSTCHADISQVIPRNDRWVTIKNYPPDPRVEGRVSSFRNEVEAELVNRHLIGYWKNVNDAYYFGSIHLAVLPGETVMEGYYTCFLGDIQVATERWKWVRLDLDPLSDVELSQVVLQEPRLIHALVERHSQHDIPLALTEVTEGI
ncbi:MAG: hypothetical protein LC775_05210, partial [Acidobacteria bacterium]|nr:hypothetical protein [Acidobacteriota bacterium]